MRLCLGSKRSNLVVVSYSMISTMIPMYGSDYTLIHESENVTCLCSWHSHRMHTPEESWPSSLNLFCLHYDRLLEWQHTNNTTRCQLPCGIYNAKIFLQCTLIRVTNYIIFSTQIKYWSDFKQSSSLISFLWDFPHGSLLNAGFYINNIGFIITFD